MKANAPEKIYLQKYDENTLIFLNRWNISDEWTNKPFNEKVATNIEYVRKDAFIEKACEYFRTKKKCVFACIGEDVYKSILNKEEIEDFKNYMKGE